MTKILAIDLGKFKSVACLFETETNQTEFCTMTTDRHYLKTVLRNYTPDLVVVEACAISGWVSDFCQQEGYQVLVCSPSQEAWQWKNVKRKTDKDDALKLAKLAALGQLVPVYVPREEQREYRSAVTYRKKLVGRINQVKNRIRAVFLRRGLLMPRGQSAWTVNGLGQIGEHARSLSVCSLGEFWRGELALELKQLLALNEQLKEVEERLDQFAKENSRVQLLQTIPGVGRKTAEVVVAYLDDPTRFKNGRQVSSYGGFTPRRYQSGEMDRSGRINKRGSRLMRTALVEAAWAMLRYNEWARTVYKRIRGKQKTRKKQAIIALARKLLVRCWVMLLRNEPWDPKREDVPKDRTD